MLGVGLCLLVVPLVVRMDSAVMGWSLPVVGALLVAAGICFGGGRRTKLEELQRQHGASAEGERAARRQTEEKFQESERRLARIVAQVPGTLFEFRPTAGGAPASPFVELAKTNHAGEPWRHVFPADHARVTASFANATAAQTLWACDYRVQSSHGAIRWLHATALPTRAADGVVVWQGVVTDITERKQAEQAHEEGRVLLQSVFSSVDLGVFVVALGEGGAFRFMEINPAYERLTGLHAAEIRGREPRELVPLISGEMAGCLHASFVRGAAATQPIEYEEPFFARGKLLWLLTRLTPIRDAAGNVVRLVGRSLEITERKAIELRLQSLTERLQLATDAAQVGIWDHDVIQDRIVWDGRMHTLYGLKAGGFGGNYRAWRERVHPDDIDRAEHEYRDALEARKPFNTSFRIIRPDGEVRKIRVCANAQRNPAGRATRVVGINWDVTAEDRAQSEIACARDEAEQLNVQLEMALARATHLAQEAGAATVAKSEFLANMSHEIRTPLNAVIGMCGLLLGTELSAEQREFAETIRSSGDGLLDLLNDLLDYSKIESGRLDLEVRPFDLHECIESAMDVLGGRAAEKKIDLIYALGAGVPELLTGDDTRLRQVFVNLLGNAVKFTTQGEVFLEVSVASLAGASEQITRLKFTVRDTGIGIPADRMNRLFRTFSQVDASTTRQYGGTGLGLAICKKIVELMGGRIWAESEEGRGSAFCFEIDAEAPAASPRPFVAARGRSLPGRRVLIVEDNATQRDVLARQCAAWGMVPETAASGAEAIARIAQGGPFDLALVDAELPVMSGADLVAAIRRERSAVQLPVAMLTVPGHARMEPGLGSVAVISKPVKVGALFEAMAAALRGGTGTAAEIMPAPAVLATTRPLSILLAEDNPVNQRVAILMLQRLGYRADSAANGREALEAVLRRRYDVVLMDVQMPEMDGLQATREICARLKADVRPRIVAMTANVSTTDRTLCSEAGMDDFLSKPVREADLRLALLATPVRVAESAA